AIASCTIAGSGAARCATADRVLARAGTAGAAIAGGRAAHVSTLSPATGCLPCAAVTLRQAGADLSGRYGARRRATASCRAPRLGLVDRAAARTPRIFAIAGNVATLIVEVRAIDVGTVDIGVVDIAVDVVIDVDVAVIDVVIVPADGVADGGAEHRTREESRTGRVVIRIRRGIGVGRRNARRGRVNHRGRIVARYINHLRIGRLDHDRLLLDDDLLLVVRFQIARCLDL